MKQTNRFSESEAKIYIAQILACLESIHGENIKHRDIKPENIMLDEHNNIKIVNNFVNF
jgi:serine/threonine protein kinase